MIDYLYIDFAQLRHNQENTDLPEILLLCLFVKYSRLENLHTYKGPWCGAEGKFRKKNNIWLCKYENQGYSL